MDRRVVSFMTGVGSLLAFFPNVVFARHLIVHHKANPTGVYWQRTGGYLRLAMTRHAQLEQPKEAQFGGAASDVDQNLSRESAEHR